MDLNTIERVLDPERVSDWGPGYAWLAGGTWLFSEPQTHLDTLVDLRRLKWPALETRSEGLEIAATCTIAELAAWKAPDDWVAAPLIKECCRAFLASWKIWHEATVGGNLCMSLPAGPMITLTSALEGTCAVWPRQGERYTLPVTEFVVGNNRNVLQSGDLLRSLWLPARTLRYRWALRRATSSQIGRSVAFLVGTRCPEQGRFVLTVSAATLRPVQLEFASLPTSQELAARLESSLPAELYLDDPHGSPGYRRHLTRLYAQEIREELA